MVGTVGSILESPRRRLRPVSSLRAIHDRIREADGINRCRCFSKKHRPGPCFDNAGRDHFGNGYAERSSLRRSERQFAAVGKCLFQEFQYHGDFPAIRRASSMVSFIGVSFGSCTYPKTLTTDNKGNWNSFEFSDRAGSDFIS